MYILNNSLDIELELCLMQNLAMWKVWTLKWKKIFLLCQCCPFLLSCICTCPQWKQYLQAVFYIIAGNDYLLIVHWREFPWRPCSPYHPARGPFVLLYALQSGSHPSSQSLELRTWRTGSKLWSYEEDNHFCRNSYFMFLLSVPSFLSCLG